MNLLPSLCPSQHGANPRCVLFASYAHSCALSVIVSASSVCVVARFGDVTLKQHRPAVEDTLFLSRQSTSVLAVSSMDSALIFCASVIENKWQDSCE
jgi:hypothetical protein